MVALRAPLTLAIALCLLMAGCGGNVAVIDVGRPVPPYTPNYLKSPSLPDGVVTSRFANPTTQPITFRITGGASNIPGVNLPRTVRLAAQAWNKPLVGLAAVQSIDGPAQIEFFFVPKHSLDDGTGRVYGQTSYVFVAGSSDQIIQSATVKIDEGMLPGTMAACAAHETGHALGIRGHSPNSGDLMFGVASELPVVVHITVRDGDTIAAIYAAQVGN